MAITHWGTEIIINEAFICVILSRLIDKDAITVDQTSG
jgi:hypothetical protein